MKRHLGLVLWVMITACIFSTSPAFAIWPFDKQTPPETTDQALSREKNEFQDLVTSFSSETIHLKLVINDGRESLVSFKEAVKIAAAKNVEFRKVYDKWTAVDIKNQSVIEMFKRLITGAEDFYKAAEAHANTIHDPALRSEALNQIKASKDAYLIRLKSTKEKLEEVSKLKTKVDDTMKYLEVVQAMKVIEERINIAFEEIDKLLPSLMSELEALNVDSQQFLKSTAAEAGTK